MNCLKMDKLMNKINEKYPCREQIVRNLFQLVGDPEECFPNAIYLYGHTGTGKSSIIKYFLEVIECRSAIVDCIGCYTTKLFFENIINLLQNHVLEKSNNYAPFAKCESMKDFIEELKHLQTDQSYVICIENADRLRDMEYNILPALLRLQEFTGLNICVILVSQIPFEKYYVKTGLQDIITIHCPQYTKNQVEKILLKDFDYVRNFVESRIMKKAYQDNCEEYEIQKQVLTSLQSDFYENYLNVFLNVFYRACRNLPELKTISRDCFEYYCEPVINCTIDRNDVSKLWRNIAKPLRSALSTIYMRTDQSIDKHTSDTFDNNQSTKKLAQILELPYYAKFLLIAGYIASHNDARQDRRLFVKDHGRKKKRVQTVNANAKVTDKMSTNLGPKSFTVDRLLAIFYAILEEKVGLTCNLLAQISTLIQLKFLSFVSGENNIMEGSARLQCTVGLDFILAIGKVVGFNVRQYLCDFM